MPPKAKPESKSPMFQTIHLCFNGVTTMNALGTIRQNNIEKRLKKLDKNLSAMNKAASDRDRQASKRHTPGAAIQ
jgi:hypothetical protein